MTEFVEDLAEYDGGENGEVMRDRDSNAWDLICLFSGTSQEINCVYNWNNVGGLRMSTPSESTSFNDTWKSWWENQGCDGPDEKRERDKHADDTHDNS